jgi:hypothetical protein
MAIAIGDVMEFRVVTQQAGQAGINVVHFRCSARSGAGATEQQVVNAMDALVSVPIKNILATTASYRGLGMRKISPLPVGVEFISTTGGGNGLGGIEGLPPGVCGMITKKTAIPGRQHRGRVYVPFPAESNNGADGRPIAAYLASLDIYANAVLGSGKIILGTGIGNDLTIDGVVWSRVGAGSSTQISGWTNRPRWATQRRRSDYGKQNVAPF